MTTHTSLYESEFHDRPTYGLATPDANFDIAIVGGGLTGMSAALELAA